MPTWPTTLPKPLVEAVTYESAENTIRTQMDAGLPKMRRRFTSVPETANFRLLLTRDQVQVLQDFVSITLSDVLSFTWKEFRLPDETFVDGTSNTATYRFLGRPRFTPAGSGLLWHADISLEILSSSLTRALLLQNLNVTTGERETDYYATMLTYFDGTKQGVVVKLSDFSTLFQDTAGTVPVTAVGQTVKRIEDQSGNGNHLTNSTGMVLGLDGDGYYLQSGASFFTCTSFAWGSDKASVFFGCKKDSGTGGSIFQFGNIISQTGAFELLYSSNGILAYRRGSGSGGGRLTKNVGDLPIIAGAILDLSGATHTTENPHLRVLGTEPEATTISATDTGSGNFGTYAIKIGTGQSLLTGQIRSGMAIADDLTAAQYAVVEAWLAEETGMALVNIAAPAPDFLDTGAESQQSGYVLTSAFSRAVYETDATAVLVTIQAPIDDSFSTRTELGVYVDGVFQEAILPAVATPFTRLVRFPAGTKNVEFVGGTQSSPTQAFPPLGTFFVSAVADAEMTVVPETPTNRIVVYGDSIASGSNSTTPVSQAWAMLVRSAYAPDSLAVEAFGFRSLYMDCVDASARAAFVAKIVAYNPSILWMAIGTNDYGLNKWTAAEFGTAYAALLDALHVALPSLEIYCQTPLSRTTETANTKGSTLGDYRTQISTVVSTRTSYATLVDGTAIMTTGDMDDGVHPTTAGHVLYADYVKTTLGIP